MADSNYDNAKNDRNREQSEYVRPKPAALGSGQAARAADAGKKHNERVGRSTRSAMDAMPWNQKKKKED